MSLSGGHSERDEAGVVLVVVLLFALLLASTVATFVSRATVDTMIARNRESAAQAEAIARGGVRLATVLLLEDKLHNGSPGKLDSGDDLWAQLSDVDIPIDDNSTLRLRIQDAGDKLNLNATFQFDKDGQADPTARPYLEAILEKVIDELPISPADRALYDPNELAGNLIDYVDKDNLRLDGGYEDDVYQQRDPPQRAANRPLLSVDELCKVEGFDQQLVDALRPYVTVYPYAGQTGINPNTAAPYVLGLIYYNDGGQWRLAADDTGADSIVRQMLQVRQDQGLICDSKSDQRCTPISSIMNIAGVKFYPPLGYDSDVYTVQAAATVSAVRRTVEAVLDRKAGGDPILLSWRVL